MSKQSRRKITESFAVTFVLIVVLFGTAVFAQVRQVDQGRAATTTANVWLMKICDSSGANCGTFAIPVTGTITATPTGTQAVSGTIGQITTGTMQANAGTGTLGMDLAKVLGAALTTANPVIDGGRAATDTVTGVANGAAVGFQLDKAGRLVAILGSPQELWATANSATLTATTASAILAAPGANYRWAITGWKACNTNATTAVRVDLLDGTTAKDSFIWAQTATTAGEPRCYASHEWWPPFLMTANTAVNVQLSVAVTDVRIVVTGFKTQT